MIGTANILLTSVGLATMLSKDILNKTIDYSIIGLSNTFAYFSESNENVMIQKYQEELENLDIELKLKLIRNWLHNINTDIASESVNTELMYSAISDSCHNIAIFVELINNKINAHSQKWFHKWRFLDLKQEIRLMKKHTKILNERLLLLNLM
jgi:hypothetical protein